MNICIILARAGSKRLLGKNKKMFFGKPVYQYSVETAVKANIFDKIILASDDNEILLDSVAKYSDIHIIEIYKRDTVTDIETMNEAIDKIYDRLNLISTFIFVLYAIAPLIKPEMINEAYNIFINRKDSGLIARDKENVEAGAFYIYKPHKWMNCFDFINYYLNDAYCCDVDTPEDWNELERKYQALKDLGEI